MAATNRLSLLIETKTVGSKELEGHTAALNRFTAATERAAQRSEAAGLAHKAAGESGVNAAKNLAIAAAGIISFGAAFRYLSTEVAGFAARAETLGVVIDSLSRANNLNSGAVRAQVEEVKKLGIATTEARESIAKMMFAQLDLRKATQLARVAQDAGVIAGVKTAEAFAGITHAITTRQIRELRTYGIAVSFADKFTAASKKLGRELTETEKNQIALNAVLGEGSKIMGTYEAAMTTAGKQVTSLSRYYDEARIAVGDEFIPIYGRVVELLTEGAKAIAENASGFANLATGITAAGAALMAAKFMPGGPLFKGAAAAVAGGAVLLSGNVDAEKYYIESGSKAIINLREQQAAINKAMAVGELAPDIAEKKFRALGEAITAIREQTIEALAKILKEDFEKIGKPLSNADRLRASSGWIHKEPKSRFPTAPISLGPHVAIWPSDIAEAITREKPAPGDQPLFDVERAAALRAAADAETAAENNAKRIESITERIAASVASGSTGIAKIYHQTENFIASLPGQVTYEQRKRLYSVDSAESIRALPLGNWGKELIPWQQLALAPQVPAYTAYGGAGAKTEWIDPTLSKESLATIDALRVSRLREALSYQEQMVELLSGPGGEVAAIKAISELRIESAQKQFAITKDEAAFNDAIWRAEKERQVELLRLRQEGLNAYRDAVVSAFDALVSRGGGFGAFLQSQALGVGRQIAGNLAGMTYKAAAGRLTLPGQGTAEHPSKLGQLLTGTPFGLDPLKTATDMNTVALAENTIAIRAMTAGVGIGGATRGLAGLMTGAFPAASGNLPYIDYLNQQQINAPLAIAPPGGGGLTAMQGIGIAGAGVAGAFPPVTSNPSYIDYLNQQQINAPLAIAPPGGGGLTAMQGIGIAGAGVAGAFPPVTSNPSYIDYLNQQQINAPLAFAPPGGTGTGIGLAQGVGIAGAGAAGAFGIYSGIKQGGVRGGLTASGAGLGAAGTIMALAGVTGPAAPIMMAAGLGLGVITSLLGDQKEGRREEMQLRIDSARITIDGPTTIQMTGTGHGFDYNVAGGMRTIGEDQIADAVYSASQRGHKVNAALREAVLR